MWSGLLSWGSVTLLGGEGEIPTIEGEPLTTGYSLRSGAIDSQVTNRTRERAIDLLVYHQSAKNKGGRMREKADPGSSVALQQRRADDCYRRSSLVYIIK